MKVLHVGCGGSALPFNGCTEVRLDMDPEAGADITGSMLDIPMPDASVDAVYSSHALEHVTYHDGLRALREFWRVLKPGGRAWVVVPNIGAVADRIARGALYETLYESPGGSVCAADMIYGHQGFIARARGDRAYRWQHQFGYTPETLGQSFRQAGFSDVAASTINKWDAVCTGMK